MKAIRNRKTLCLLTISLLTLLIWRSGTEVSAQSGKELTATANFSTDHPLAPDTSIEITLSRTLTSAEKFAATIGTTDVSGLFAFSETLCTYNAALMPLPVGRSDLTVYAITPDGNWNEVARLPMVVEISQIEKEVPAVEVTDTKQEKATETTVGSTEAESAAKSTNESKTEEAKAEEAKAEEPKTETASEPVAAAKKRSLKFLPSFTLSVPSQPFQGNFPIETRPSKRATSIDLDLTGSLKIEGKAGILSGDANFDFAGSSFKEKTLQFGTLGEKAPDVDLSSYLINLQIGKAKFSLGHTSFGTNRHLVSGFSSRGLSLSIPINKRFDITAGILNGTSVLGIYNFLGMSNVRHQMQGLTVGIELFPKRPGAMRLELSGFNGYLQALNNVSEGQIVDVEQSRGAGLRFLTTDKSGRFKLEFGYALSRFFNPEDKTLDPDGNAVPVAPATRAAHYIDTSYQAIKDLKLSKTRTLNLSLGFRYEFVEPLYHSIGASASADKFTNDFTADASIGEITFQFAHARSDDNLRNVPSILKSLTRSNRFSTAIPLAALFGIGERSARFFPRLGYSIDRTHNFGEGIPVGGGFEIDPATIPDLLNTSQNFSSAWQFKKFGFEYTYSRSFADNRQATSAKNDQLGWVHSTSFNMTPIGAFSFNVGFSFDSQNNFELGTVNQTTSMNFGSTWKPFKNASLVIEASQALSGDLARTSRNRNINYSGQFSYSLSHEKSRFKKYGMQVFARFADAYVRNRDFTSDSNQLTRTKIMTAGLTVNFF